MMKHYQFLFIHMSLHFSDEYICNVLVKWGVFFCFHYLIISAQYFLCFDLRSSIIDYILYAVKIYKLADFEHELYALTISFKLFQINVWTWIEFIRKLFCNPFQDSQIGKETLIHFGNKLFEPNLFMIDTFYYPK